MYTPQQIADTIVEEEVSVNDNELSSLIHHLEDAIKGYRSGEEQVVMSSLTDIREIAMRLVQKLSPAERREL